MNPIPLLPALADLALKSLLLCAAAFAIAPLLRRRSAAVRNALWAGLFAVLALLPVTHVAPIRWAEAFARPDAAGAGGELAPILIRLDWLPAAHAAATPAAPGIPAPDASVLCVWLWVGVAILLVGRHFLGLAALPRLRANASTVTAGRARALLDHIAGKAGARVQLRVSSECPVPVTWGIFHPILLLPADSATWSDARLEAALRHELGHIARRDWATRMAAEILCALYWFNPLVWIAARQLRLAQEEACDDLVLGHHAHPADYAEQLLEAGRRAAAFDRTNPALAMARPTTLGRRIRSVVDPDKDRRLLGRAGAFWAGIAAAVCVAASSLTAFGAGDAKTPANPAPKQPDAAGPQVTVSTQILQLSKAAAADPALANLNQPGAFRIMSSKATAEWLAEVSKKKGVDILSAPKVTTLSGQKARIEVGRELEDGKGGKLFAGERIEILPVVKADSIDLDFATLHAEQTGSADGKPLVESRQIDTRISVLSGQSVALGGLKTAEDLLLIYLVTATVGEQDLAAAPAATDAEDQRTAAVQAEPRGRRRIVVRDARPEDDRLAAVQAKMASIIIPKASFRDAQLAEAVAFFQAKARELDPAGEGVAISIKDSKNAGVAPAKITAEFNNIPLSEALKYIAALCDHEVVVTPPGVILSPR